MDASLFEKLSQISDTERSVLAENYNLLSDAEPAFANMKLKRRDFLWNVLGTQQMVSARPHTRFVDIPIHSHSYLEMMIVCLGTVTHFIEGRMVLLEEGEILLMNRHVKHAILASGERDVAVNLIISPDFLSYAAARFRNDSSFRDFAEQDRLPDGKPRFLQFHIGEKPAIRNLIDNLLFGTLTDGDTPQTLMADTLALLFRYLESDPSLCVRNTGAETEEGTMSRQIQEYLDTSYRTASLAELSDKFGLSAPYVSRRIRELFGFSFSELLKEKRFSEAERLLLHSSLSVSEIAQAIGYENNSFFHRRFREQYGTSPAKWRAGK